MAAKLRTQNRKIVARASPLMEKIPVATISSTNVQPDFDFSRGLINIILDAVLCHVSAETPAVGDATAISPRKAHIELPDAARVIRRGPYKYRCRDRHRAIIGRSL